MTAKKETELGAVPLIHRAMLSIMAEIGAIEKNYVRWRSFLQVSRH